MSRKQKRKRTAAERKRRRETVTIFVNGKQKRVPRPQLIEGLEVDEFIRRNADPIWLHQNEMWELIHEQHESTNSSKFLGYTCIDPADPSELLADCDDENERMG